MTFDQAREAYEEQVRGLIDGGADLLLLETIFDTLNAKAGIVAIENVFEEKGVRLPLLISVTITDRSGRTLSGQTLDAFYTSIRHARPLSVGINCALGARDMRPYLAELARIAECYVSCYPNAGLPNAFGAVRRAARRDRRRCCATSRRAASSTSSAAAAARRRITSARWPRRSRAEPGSCRASRGWPDASSGLRLRKSEASEPRESRAARAPITIHSSAASRR